MRLTRLAVLLVLFAAPGLVTAGVAAQAPAPFPAEEVAASVRAEARIRDVWTLCPADAWARDAPFYAAWVKPASEDAELCARTPATCLRRCVDGAESGACFGLARALQLHDPRATTPEAEMLFGMACDAGMGAGCTNRASGLRNAPVDGDALRDLTREAQEDCEYRSFRIGCNQGDSWSCAMQGQAVRLGEGVAPDPVAARALFDRACELSPRYVSCDFARGQAELMERRRGRPKRP